MKTITYIKTDNYIYEGKECVMDYVAIHGDGIAQPQVCKINHDKLNWKYAVLPDGTQVCLPICAERIFYNRYGRIVKVIGVDD